MVIAKTPAIVRRLYPGLIWRMPEGEKHLYLTFDDGPVPEATPWVLKTLDDFGVKATFFCVGSNAVAHPELIQKIKEGGHAIGNHTFSHKNGWDTDARSYVRDVVKCKEVLPTRLFRPPYGRIRRKQAGLLQGHFEIIMWDVLSWDFSVKVDQETCYHYAIDNARPGSIIVFHDSIKARKNLRFALPRALDHWLKSGYLFKTFEEWS